MTNNRILYPEIQDEAQDVTGYVQTTATYRDRDEPEEITPNRARISGRRLVSLRKRKVDEVVLIAAQYRTGSRTKPLHQQKVRCGRTPGLLELGTERKRLFKVRRENLRIWERRKRTPRRRLSDSLPTVIRKRRVSRPYHSISNA